MSTTSKGLRLGVFFLLALVLQNICAPKAEAQVHPAKIWKSLSLEHFELIYDAENQQLAELYALRLRALEPTLKSHWAILPPKTVVVLNDRTDLTNGYATFLPYPLIMVFPVLPGPMDTIGEYDDWAWEIIVHEYTHILEFSQRRGVINGLSYVFGSIVTPNALLPRWSLEGAAVEAETRHSNAGRLRSKMQAGILRALEKDKVLESVRLSEINEFAIPTFPYGSRPYLYGSTFWSDLTFAKNEAATRDLHLLTGGRLPYMLDAPFEQVFDGKDQVELFAATRTQMVNAAQKEIAQLSTVPLTEGKVVDPEMIESLSPAVSPDGLKLAYVSKNHILRRRVQVLVRPAKDVAFEPSHRMEWFGREFDQSLPSGSPIPRAGLGVGAGLTPNSGILESDVNGNDSPPGGNITRVSWHPNSQSFVFDQVYEKNRFQELSDLWVFDLVQGKATKLTNGERAREPAYSPDGKRVAFVRIQAGRTELSLYDPEAKVSTNVFASKPQARVSFPAWFDDKTLLFSLRENGREKLMKLTLGAPVDGKSPAGSTAVQVLKDVEDPQFVTVEKDRLLFTATNNGVRNLYRAKLDFSGATPVTNSASHVLSSSYDEAGHAYYYTEITKQGYELKALPETAAVTTPLPVIKAFWAGRYAEFKQPTLLAPETAEVHDFSPWGYLWPHYWLPYASWDDRGTYLTVQTGGSDPLSKHAYSLTGAYDSSINRGSYVFNYINQVYWPYINLQAYDVSLALANDRSYSRSVAYSAIAALQVAGISPDWLVGAGIMSTESTKFEHTSQRTIPLLISTYNAAFQTAAQVTPETGWLGSATYGTPYDPDLKKFFNRVDIGGSVFFSKWLPARHAVMLSGELRYSDEPFRVQDMMQSISQRYTSTNPVTGFLNRGYPSGTFLGRSVADLNLEYRFPVQRLDWAKDGWAFYVHRSHAALIMDTTMVDGYLYNFKPDEVGYYRADWGHAYSTLGAELLFDGNAGYAVPFTLGIGIYWPLDTSIVTPGPRLGLSLVL